MALVGDRERERAADALKEHYLRGRLSVEELADRLEVALAARREADVRRALADLPAVWRARELGQRARRAVLVAAVWVAWWSASLVLLAGFVVTVAVDGFTWANGLLFAALWAVMTFSARRISRRAR